MSQEDTKVGMGRQSQSHVSYAYFLLVRDPTTPFFLCRVKWAEEIRGTQIPSSFSKQILLVYVLKHLLLRRDDYLFRCYELEDADDDDDHLSCNIIPQCQLCGCFPIYFVSLACRPTHVKMCTKMWKEETGF